VEAVLVENSHVLSRLRKVAGGAEAAIDLCENSGTGCNGTRETLSNPVDLIKNLSGGVCIESLVRRTEGKVGDNKMVGLSTTSHSEVEDGVCNALLRFSALTPSRA
jgi:hypothetical protein